MTDIKTNPEVVLRKKRNIHHNDYVSNNRVEIIDLKHDYIQKNKRGREQIYIKFDKDQVIISTAARNYFQITPEQRAHFVNDGSEWLVYFDKDPDGFYLKAPSGKQARNHLTIQSMPLLHLFVKRNKVRLPSKYPMVATGYFFEDKPLIRIDLTKPFEIHS